MKYKTASGRVIELSKSVMVAHTYKQEFKKSIFLDLKPLFEGESAEYLFVDPSVVFPVFYAMAKTADKKQFGDYWDFLNYWENEKVNIIDVVEKVLMPYLETFIPTDREEEKND